MALKYSNDIYDTKFKPKLIEMLPKTYEDIKPYVTWDNEEFNKFINCIDNEVYVVLFNFLYKTGCRKQEVLDLTWDRVVDNTATFTHTKTLSSNRTILIDKDP